MADEKKYADEMLTDEELDKVAGGTYAEAEELQALFGYRVSNNSYSRKKAKSVSTSSSSEIISYNKSFSEVESWLKEHLNIDANLHYTHFWPWTKADPNTYSRNGVSLTHEQVVAEVKDKLMNG